MKENRRHRCTALLLALLVGAGAQASPPAPGGTTKTAVGAEACRAYEIGERDSFEDTLWGIRNAGATAAWVSCPIVAQQSSVYPLGGNNSLSVTVVGYAVAPAAITCQLRAQDFTGAAIETQSESFSNNTSTPFPFALAAFPTPSSSWSLDTLAARVVLWCLIPPGAHLYYYALHEAGTF